MRHWPDLPQRFEISIRLETVEAGGLSTPIYAKPASAYEIAASQIHNRRIPIVRPPAGEPVTVATFVFQTTRDRYVVPPGFKSNWITIAGPPK